jgi:ribose transport system permease protein
MAESTEITSMADQGGEATRRLRLPVGAGQRYALPFAFLVVIMVFSLRLPDTFFTAANFESILGSQAVLVVLALGLLPQVTMTSRLPPF